MAVTITAGAAAQTRLELNSGNTLTPIAGNGRDSRTAAGSSTATSMGSPRGLVYDAAGNLYVSDSRNNVVTRTSPQGTLAIVAGNGQEGFSGDGGPATAAALDHPSAIVLRNDGTLLIADSGNHRLRSVGPDGIIHTVAGTGIPGNSGDGDSALRANLRTPAGLAIDRDGSLLLADTGNHRIRRLRTDGTIAAVAGTGQEGDTGDGGPALAAALRAPTALAVLPDGRILIADREARRIRVLGTDGTIAAYAAPALRRPEGLTTDAAGNLLIADAALQELFQVGAGAATLAGTGQQGAATTGAASATALDSPASAALDGHGNIALSDRRNHQVEQIALPLLSFGSVPAGQTSASQTIFLHNAGIDGLTVTAVTLPSGFEDTGNGSCPSIPLTLQSQQQCTMAVVFHPQVQGAVQGFGRVETGSGPTAMIALNGTGIAGGSLTASSTALASNGNISYVGSPVLLTATVVGQLQTPPTGNVAFQDGPTTLTSVPLAAGKATYATAALAPGQHALHAAYSGDTLYASSLSANLSQTVIAAPDFSLLASAASYSGSASGTVTIPLTLLPQNGTLNHTVSLSVSGLPSGATGRFSPPVVTLAGDPANASLILTLPATLSFHGEHTTGILAIALLLTLALPRRRRSASLLVLAATLSLEGCGGGFRAVVSGNGGTATAQHYHATVTASTSGVLGDTLTHSIPVELVITP